MNEQIPDGRLIGDFERTKHLLDDATAEIATKDQRIESLEEAIITLRDDRFNALVREAAWSEADDALSAALEGIPKLADAFANFKNHAPPSLYETIHQLELRAQIITQNVCLAAKKRKLSGMGKS